MAEQTSTGQQEAKQRYWKQQVEGWSMSGLSQAECCRKHKLSAKSFTYWKKRFKEKVGGPSLQYRLATDSPH